MEKTCVHGNVIDREAGRDCLHCVSERTPTSKYEDLICLGSIVQWWDALPPRLRQDIEGSGAEPGCIAKARRIFNHHAIKPF